MDQLIVDLGDVPAEADDEVVLLGRQGDEEITATEWAERLGTISYEIVTGIGARVPRTYTGERVQWRPRALKRTGLVAGVAAGVVGRRLRGRARARRPDPPPRRSRRRAPAGPGVRRRAACSTATTAATIYTITRGDGPPVVFCHGVTLSSRVWAKQFETFPAAGFRAVAFDSRGHGESTAGRDGSLDRQPRRRPAHGARGARPPRRDPRRALDGWHGGAGVRDPSSRRRWPQRVRGLVLQSTASHNLVSDARRVRQADRARRRARARPRLAHAATQPRSAARAHRVRRRPASQPRRGHPPDARRVQPRDRPARRPRRCSSLDLTDGLPVDRRPHARARGHGRRAHAAQRLRAASPSSCPGARLVEYPGAGHMLMYERTEEVDALIIDFARACRRCVDGRRLGRLGGLT